MGDSAYSRPLNRQSLKAVSRGQLVAKRAARPLKTSREALITRATLIDAREKRIRSRFRGS